jgi:hemolysin-activating ACP:hemolysin acyltransferase
MQLRSLNRVYAKTVSDDVAILSAMKLARFAPLSWDCSAAELCQLLLGASAHNKLQLLFDEDEKPVAFYIWANLAFVTVSRLVKSERLKIEPYEWSESTLSTIVLCSSLPLRLRGAISHARDQVFNSEATIRFIRKKRGVSHLTQFSNSGSEKRWLRSLSPFDNSCRCGQLGCTQI